MAIVAGAVYTMEDVRKSLEAKKWRNDKNVEKLTLVQRVQSTKIIFIFNQIEYARTSGAPPGAGIHFLS